MRTPKRLYAQERIIYHPELLTCPGCGAFLVGHNYLAWDKTIQTLDQVLSIASRPGRCPHHVCPGSRLHLLSAQGQSIAIPNSTYGLDVLVRIGWLRTEYHATYGQVHADLSRHIDICESHVRYLYQQVYLPLLACHQRQQEERLAEVAQQQGGLVIALDGLEPESGEPQLWFIRDLLTGLTLRSGWLSQLTQLAFEDFLAPLRQLPWPILAVLSDKQTGLVPAVASVFPHSRHQFCQAHYLRNLAEPLTEADGALKTELRRAVRDHVGDVIRREPRPAGSPHGVLTVTGFVPDTNVTPPSSDAVTPASVVSPAPPDAAGDEVVNHLVRHTRYLLTLKGRPPFCLAGIETYERLQGVATLSLDLLTERLDMRLIHLYQGLKAALAPFADTYDAIQRGAVWLRDISDILGPPDASTLSAQDISGDLRGYINAVMHESDGSPLLHDFGRHLDKVSQSYWPGLFHCYDIPALARTNNEVESHFRDTQRRLLRTTGQKGQTRRTLHRLGAWELLPRPSSEAACVEALSHIPPKDFMQERQRVRQHRQRFRFQVRSLKGTNAQFERLRQQWRTTQKTDTG